MPIADATVGPQDRVLITGGAGFIGTRVVKNLLERGFCSLRCLVRPSSNLDALKAIVAESGGQGRVEFVNGNLLSAESCAQVVKDVTVIYHLAAGRGEKMVPDAFMNTVVATRNLLVAAHQNCSLKRFVSVSSFSVYSNADTSKSGFLDETSPLEAAPAERGDAYSFVKIKQDELVAELGAKYEIPYVIVRPGVVYGPGNEKISGRVGIDTFGIFLHLGGSSPVPLTYVDNCAEAIVLAGLRLGIEKETFNVVDDDVPTSRQFLRLYKKNVKKFASIYVPKLLSYFLCFAWEKYSSWSEGQLPPVFNRKMWCAYWKRTRYTNAKLKTRLGWTPKVSTEEALERLFQSCKRKRTHA